MPGRVDLSHDFLSYETILDYKGGDNRKGRDRYRQFIKQGIGEMLENPLDLGKGKGIVGDAHFVERIKERFLDKEAAQREQPALRQLTRTFDPEQLIDHFVHLVGKPKERICRRGKKTIERTMLMELLYRFCRIPQPEIGRLVGGIDYSGVSQARRRFQIKLENEPNLKKKFNELSEQLVKLSRLKI